jgi:adenomatosis polyposis coli protein
MVEMVYSLLEMLRLSSAEEMSTKLLLMSQSPQICVEMRQLGCLSLLIQLLHQQNDDQIECNDRQKLLSSHEMRQKANKTLRNIIINSAKSKRELRILRLIEDLRSFVDLLRLRGHELSNDVVDHPSSSVAHLLKVSFDEQHRQVIGLLGGVYAIAQVSHH